MQVNYMEKPVSQMTQCNNDHLHTQQAAYIAQWAKWCCMSTADGNRWMVTVPGKERWGLQPNSSAPRRAPRC
jgi:hypothetical protein